ncbi:WD40/YVTN/BNR-like repeat-containing protein [Neolewinella antarctica]|uniref:Photosystem II stability/assembly factor-like uncharacterized protein n=1 Tax=Neolewinella antarctica TaxID=442734 RepID=A0ABX0X8H8_9BACT|nr:hypothetical protein [Neolewinella antarctica]NJC25340.1 photosystem II stability/assembly factor-like uncharacterized protein [Neolewinella antarctica]
MLLLFVLLASDPGAVDSLQPTEKNPRATIFLSDDTGSSWYYLDAGLPPGTSPRDVLEHDGTIYLTTFNKVYALPAGATSWEERSSGLINLESTSSIAAAGDLLVLGTLFQGVYVSRSGGRHWSRPVFNIDKGGYVRSLCFYDGRLYAGTDTGIFTSTDGAHTWSRSGEMALINVIAPHQGQLFVARQNGVGVYAAGEITWTDLKTDWAISQLYSHAGYLYATSAVAEIYRSQDGGSWEKLNATEGHLKVDNTSVPAALWSGYAPDLPGEHPLGYILSTSRGWIATGKSGC